VDHGAATGEPQRDQCDDGRGRRGEEGVRRAVATVGRERYDESAGDSTEHGGTHREDGR